MIAMLGVIKVQSKVTCIGENGDPVDMFIIYKLPRVAAYPGSRYLYLDSNDLNFRPSKHHISSVDSSIGKTLQQIYIEYNGNNMGIKSGSDKIAHIFYNDGVPKAPKYDHAFGHTKGEVGFDKETGFWVIQSVPNFPSRVAEGYIYPRTGFKYGQMMMCISFKSSMFHAIGDQLKLAKPHIYDSNLPAGWENTYKEIYDVIKGNFLEASPSSNLATLTSLKGKKYLHFSKNAKYGHDLYHHFVAPTLKSNLIVETWQHGKNNIGPSCNGSFSVIDIRKVNIKAHGKSYSFLTYDDHSKYVISEKSDLPYVCVGGINRQYSQFKRGGGCICLKNIQLWEQFHSLIDRTDVCK